MVDFKTLDDLDASGKTVLVRVDLNVPVENGRIADFTRIDRIRPTLDQLADKGAIVLLLSHFGRPKGKAVPEMSLRPIAEGLSDHIGKPVTFIEDCIGEPVKKALKDAKAGDILLAENVRYHAGEEKNDADFAKTLAAAGDVYVNDAFSCSHRAHASTEAIAHLLPAYAGRNMEAELTALTKALEKPERPVMAVVGGAKISSKLDLLFNLIEKVDILVIGGGMANTFLNAQGINVGASLCEHDLAVTATEILEKAEKVGCEVLLPTDVVLAKEFKAGAESRAGKLDGVEEDEMILDIGPDSVTLLKARLGMVKTLIWNGPFGAFEIEPFDEGTVAVAKEAEKLTKSGELISVAGGGDTVSALAKADVTDGFTYISTAGGAFLEWMEGKTLPGVAALAR